MVALRLDEAKVKAAWDWHNIARPEQLEPDDYLIWDIEAGRGWGKTKTGAETIQKKIERGEARRVAFVGATAADVRDTMVDELLENSGLLSVAPPWFYPKYEPSKRRLVYPNGAVVRLFSAEEPNRLRGPQHDLAWCDELAAWPISNIELVWANLMFGLRKGKSQVIVTTTPKPIKRLIEFHKKAKTGEGRIVITNGSTFDNIAHLSQAYIDEVVEPYRGTRIGQQELYGQLLDDNPDALWTYDDLEKCRVTVAPEPLLKVGVAVDPTGSHEGHECGIMVGATAGDPKDPHGYVLGDYSIRATPQKWALEVIRAVDDWDADEVIVEKNYGGEMAASVLRLTCRDISHRPLNIVDANATRGKHVRAEPISNLYQQERIHHVGIHEVLEDQMVGFVGGDANDRVDANVWLWTRLLANRIPAIRGQKPMQQAYEEHMQKRGDRRPTTTLGSAWRRQF